eukprot:scaffold3963_cov188-Prasinococcus_capsulatus_cf.AAC.1
MTTAATSDGDVRHATASATRNTRGRRARLGTAAAARSSVVSRRLAAVGVAWSRIAAPAFA